MGAAVDEDTGGIKIEVESLLRDTTALEMSGNGT